MSTIGDLKETKEDVEIEWRISDFFGLSDEESAIYNSPDFDFAGESWFLRLNPNHAKDAESAGHISCYLFRNSSGPPITLKVEFALKKLDGYLEKVHSFSQMFNKGSSWGYIRYISRSSLIAEKSDLTPNDVLTVICRMKLDKPNVLLRRSQKLSHVLRELLIKETEKDLTVRVKGVEFKFHKKFLGIRSPVFATMVDLKLKASSVEIVDIDDCEESEFRMFMEYIYDGKVAYLCQKNFLKLYEMAEKYKMDELKEDCLNCVKDTLSIDNLLNAMEFAEKYNEKDLKSFTSKFFSKNLKDFVKHASWQTLMENDSRKASELLATALDNYSKITS